MSTEQSSHYHYDGNASIQFERRPNDDKRGMKIPAKDLNIVWGKDSRYWKIPADDESPAELTQVCWLEVTTFVDMTDPSKTYEVRFEVSLTPDAFGWASDSPLYLMVKRGKEGEPVWKKFVLNAGEKCQEIIGKTSKGQNSEDQKIYMGLYEVWSGKWKGGLKIHRAFIKELP